MQRIAIIIPGDADHADRAVADWLAGRVRLRGGAEADVLDLAAACLPDAPSCLPGAADGPPVPPPPAVDDLVPWLTAADGFLLVLKDGPPELLRPALTWCGECWRAKPVGLTWYGGSPSTEGEVRALLRSAGAVPVGAVARFGDLSCADQADHMLDEIASWTRETPETRTPETPWSE
ncbi:NAD(P)H-dependent oxidoreductase [Actinomadura sp. 9N407]|uniref:NAD(P)H-dependent oxidoreductase n=1 Tax=Actinomadura sp. 9N407 TaxID=3375154 RepID=UPI00379AC9F0